MPINHNAFSSKFQVPSLKKKEQQVAFRKWQAVFYTLRFLIWNESKSRIFKDALDCGAIEPIAPGEFNQEDIQQLYAEAWNEFQVEFDQAFVKATLEEMVEFAQSRFGMGLEDLLELNRQRSANRYNR
ncbi:MAG TPA: hypothetical protein ACFCUY_12655 [Xenococcaceae cyanobacterium]|jgi:hypothetical protein